MYFFSAFEMISIPAENISCKKLATLNPQLLSWLNDEPDIVARVEIEALYEYFVNEQAKDVADVRREEQLLIPSNFDYFA